MTTAFKINGKPVRAQSEPDIRCCGSSATRSV